MKKCKGCGVTKPDNDYYVDAKGFMWGKCKECVKAMVRANAERVGYAYDRTEHGVIRVIYKTQRSNSKKRGHAMPGYTKQQLGDWLYDNGFLELYEVWVKSAYAKDTKPSVDRIDDNKPYSLSNIKLGTWFDNRSHQYADIKNGVGTSGRRCKALYQFDGNKRLVASYVSYSQGVRTVGYSVEHQIKNGVKCRGGYYWSYTNNF